MEINSRDRDIARSRHIGFQENLVVWKSTSQASTTQMWNSFRRT